MNPYEAPHSPPENPSEEPEVKIIRPLWKQTVLSWITFFDVRILPWLFWGLAILIAIRWWQKATFSVNWLMFLLFAARAIPHALRNDQNALIEKGRTILGCFPLVAGKVRYQLSEGRSSAGILYLSKEEAKFRPRKPSSKDGVYRIIPFTEIRAILSDEATLTLVLADGIKEIFRTRGAPLWQHEFERLMTENPAAVESGQ